MACRSDNTAKISYHLPMRLRTIVKTAIVVAAVSAAVLQAGSGGASTLITDPTTLPVSAGVNNDITVSISNTDLGGFSVTGGATDTASGTFTPGGALMSTPGTGIGVGSVHPASFVWDQSHPPQTPTIDLSSGFHNAPLYVTYSNVVNLACLGGGTIRITRITDDLATPTVWSKPGAGAPSSTQGRDMLDGGGSKTFHIGMTLATTAGNTYTSGACSGSFDFTVEY